MNKLLLAAAITSLFASVNAHAQSSITLYGLIDEGADYISNAGGHSQYEMVSGDVVGSRWGLRGTEALGDGLSAVFRLENGFDINSGKLGQGGEEFGRQAYVGLSSKTYGTVTLGRQYAADVDLWSPFTAAGNTIGDLASHPMDNDNADWDDRGNNMVKYLSPVFSGVQIETTYAFSNDTNFANNRQYSVGATYAAGPFSAVAVYAKANNPGSTTGGALSSNTAFDFVGSSQQNIDAGVKWTFSNNDNIAFAYSHTDIYANDAGTIQSNVTGVALSNQQSWKMDNFEVNGQYFFTPDVWAVLAYDFTHAGVNGLSYAAANYHQVSMMFDYDISKRTSLYVQGAFVHGNSAAAQTLGVSIEGLAMSNSENQSLFRIGMTHHF